MYNLNPNTRTARFYSWIWGKDITEFRNMCPYFWKYVLTILFLPLVLGGKLMGYLASLMPRTNRMDKVFDSIMESGAARKTDSFFSWIFSHTNFWNAVGKVFKWLFFIALGALLLALVGVFIMLLIENPLKMFAGIGVSALIIVGILLLTYLFAEKNLGKILWTPFKFIGNMVYSTYKNMCPLISWSE